VMVRFAPDQPDFRVATIVQVRVVVTNVGTVAEGVRVNLTGTINYDAVETVVVAPGASLTVLFDYTVPIRLEVTLTATGELTTPGVADATPANNSETKSFSTTL